MLSMPTKCCRLELGRSETSEATAMSRSRARLMASTVLVASADLKPPVALLVYVAYLSVWGARATWQVGGSVGHCRG